MHCPPFVHFLRCLAVGLLLLVLHGTVACLHSPPCSPGCADEHTTRICTRMFGGDESEHDIPCPTNHICKEPYPVPELDFTNAQSICICPDIRLCPDSGGHGGGSGSSSGGFGSSGGVVDGGGLGDAAEGDGGDAAEGDGGDAAEGDGGESDGGEGG